jgi:hypothetical protein
VTSVPSEPSVSVIVAVHNGAGFIAGALSSILSQTAPAAEVLVVDDGSTDGTAGVVARFPSVRLLRRRDNRGQAAALNWGVARSTGSHLAFLDADDVWVPDKLARQRAALADDPALDVVYGLARQRVTAAGPDGAVVPAAMRARLGDGTVMRAHLPSAMLVSRAAFLRVGGFDGGFTVGSVVDWYGRSRAVGLREQTLDTVVYERVIHGENTGIKRRADRAEYLRVVRSAIERRRAGGSTPVAPAARAFEPSASQRWLLRALFGPADEAASAYRRWRQGASFDPLDAAVIPLMPLLYFRLRALGIDDPVAAKLKGAYRKYWAQSSLLVARAAQAQQRLEAAGIPVLVTGGVALLAFYPAGRPGCRPTAGIELLVEHAAAGAALSALGPPASPPFDVQLVPVSSGALARIRARAERRDVQGIALAVAGASELARDVCVDAWRGGAPAPDLGWVADLVQLARAGVDKAQLADEARSSGADEAVAAALAVLRDESLL